MANCQSIRSVINDGLVTIEFGLRLRGTHHVNVNRFALVRLDVNLTGYPGDFDLSEARELKLSIQFLTHRQVLG